MMKSKLLSNSLIYLLATLIQSGVQLLFIPYLTRALSIDEFGKAELFLTSYGFFNIIILFGANTQIYRDASKNIELLSVNQIGHYKVKIYNFFFYNSLFLAALLFLGYLYFGVKYGYIFFGFLTSSFYVYMVFELCIFQVKTHALKFLIFNVIFTLFNVLLTLLAINIFNFQYESRVIGYIVPSIAFFLFFISKLNFKVFTLSFSEYKERMLICSPLFFSSVASWLAESVDKIMLAKMLTLKDVAIYSVGYKFGMIMLLLTSAYSRAWMPFVIENRELKIKLQKGLFFSILMILAVCAIYILVVVNVYQLIVPKEYFVGISIVVIVSISYSIDGITKLFNGIFITNGSHAIYVSTTIIAGLSNVLFNYYLIPVYGYIGAAYSTLLSFALAFITTLLFAIYLKFKV